MKLLEWIKKPKIIIPILVILVVFTVVTLRSRSKFKDVGIPSEPLKRGMIVESVYGIGTVVATRTFPLKTGVTTTVRKLYIKEGDAVRRGQKLVDLDGTDPIFAPFNGTVTYLPVKMSETVFAQSTILIVADLSDRYITVSLEQRGALRVKNGQKARISFDSLRNQTFDGVVESVYSNDLGFLVRIGVKQLSSQILPGMSADVAIGVNQHENALLVPVAALNSGKIHVVREENKSEEIEVKTGIIDGAMAEVISDQLHEGDKVLILKKLVP